MKRTECVAESPSVCAVKRTGISQATICTVIETIAERARPEKIVIFGSCARGKAGPGSDLDLLVIMNSDLPRYKRAAPLRLLFDPAPCPIDILVFTPEEVKRWNGTINHIVTEVLEKGVVAYIKPKAHRESRPRRPARNRRHGFGRGVKSALGNAPSHKLFERAQITRKDSSKPPRDFSNYEVKVDWSNPPAGVELIEML